MQKTEIKKLLFFAIAALTVFPLFLLPLISYFYHDIFPSPSVQEGILDLEGYSLIDKRPLPLNGEWEYFEGQWIITDQKQGVEPSHRVTLPDLWRQYQKRDLKESIPQKASYRIMIANCQQDLWLAPYIPDMNASYRIFMNGQLIDSKGLLFSYDKYGYDATWQIQGGTTADENGNIELVIELESKRGEGVYITPMLSELQSLHYRSMIRSGINAVCVGILAFSILWFAILIFLRDPSYPSVRLLILDGMVFVRLIARDVCLPVLSNQHSILQYDYLYAFLTTLTMFLPIIFLYYANETLNLSINRRILTKISFFEFAISPILFFSMIYEYPVLQQMLYFISYCPFFYIMKRVYQRVKEGVEYALLASWIILLLVSTMLVANMNNSGFLIMDVSLFAPIASVLSVCMQIGMYFMKNHYMHMKIVEMEKLQLKLRESEMSIAFSQIKPHFLYNALIAIQVLCTDEPELAAETTMQFANYMRENMRFINTKEPIPFERELAHIKNYVSIEKMRFQERLTVVYEIEYQDFSVPALCIQPIVENAIKYGACKNLEGGTVTIKSYETNDGYVIEVLDNGPGFDTKILLEESDSVGIKNIRFRLQHKMGGTMQIRSEPNCGTQVTVWLPKGEVI